MAKKTHAQYVQELAAIGKVEALEEYQGGHTKILHRCLEHGEKHQATPHNCLKGRGIKCCANANLATGRGKKNKTASHLYSETIKAQGNVELLEPYIDQRTPILHRCLIHGEEHKAMPHNVGRDHGLKCCILGGDTQERLLNDEGWANSSCHVYIARINGAYLKPGIAKDPEKRANDYYGSYAYSSPAMTRAEAWAIEQRLLRESMDAKPEALPEIYQGWAGYSELRLKDVLPESWYISRFWELMAELDEEGWESVAFA